MSQSDTSLKSNVPLISKKGTQVKISRVVVILAAIGGIAVAAMAAQAPDNSRPLIEIKLVSDDKAMLDAALAGNVPSGYELSNEEGRDLLVKKDRLMLIDAFVEKAAVDTDPYGGPVISITLNSEGSRLFADITERCVDRRIAIFCDGKLASAPTVRERISSGRLQIMGHFSWSEAGDIVKELKGRRAK